MESGMINLGSSLKVPYVQELAKEKFASVPPRYIRPDPTKLHGVSTEEIPVIDMQRLLSDESVNPELEKLHFACKEWGFFQLINHGVSSSLVDKLKLEMQKFFNLTIEEKKRFAQEPGDVEGYGQAFVVSEEQKLNWGDMLFMVALPTHLRKPHLLPNLPLPFRETLDKYSRELKILAIKALEQMTKALGMELEDMTMLFQEGLQSMRMNNYPPCPQPCPQPVVPLPNAFIVNVGDILEIVTNGIYKSVEHRATVNLHNERLSIATFFSPKLDGDMGTAPSLITPENPAIFRRISMCRNITHRITTNK
ncbi:unnamed protein product [Coffea canephora]|uniref:DH200=94 genomic scaffold, scaffold_1974 n=1 Tax=Coffea canephora TaxID=49390 RepID=A0A068VJK8_COFCA|nr:unnamed protein product [Coffea canephora]